MVASDHIAQTSNSSFAPQMVVPPSSPRTHHKVLPPDEIGYAQPTSYLVADQQTTLLAEQLHSLFRYTRIPSGRKWSLNTVCQEATKYGAVLFRSHISQLLHGKVERPSVYTLQVLGMVFGIGSMGLIQPLEPLTDQTQEQHSSQQALQDIVQQSDTLQRILADTTIQHIVDLLIDLHYQETKLRAANILEEICAIEKLSQPQHST